jgi:hypothetical protein
MLAPMRRGATSASVGPDVIATYLRLLRETPVRIARATADVDAARLLRRTADEPWSVNDVLAHLRAAADVRERFIDAMSTGDHPTLRYESPRSELRRTNYVDLAFSENLAAFRGQREILLEWLARLPIQGWSRGSMIRDRPESVASYVGYLTEHETVHCEQIEALVR